LSGQARAAGGRGVAILLAGAFVAGFWSGGSLWQGVGEVLPVRMPEGSRPEQATVMAPDPEPAPVVAATLPMPVAAESVELAAPLPPARIPLPKPVLATELTAATLASIAPEQRVGKETETASVRVAAEIFGSFYQAARRADLPTAAVDELVKLLSWDVDFQRDIHPGDRFEVVLDRPDVRGGRVLREGGIAYVALRLRDRAIEAYRYTNRDGSTGYYDGEGRPLRKWLLCTPVDGARLSSLFGPRRHPVLRFTRMHKGIDFAASTGTPIFAAADGQIEVQGRNRGYGKYVRIRHTSDYSTAYAHLSRFAAGLKAGSRVQQGQVIGYVGSSGLATGPHLHYEVLKGGTQVNPMGLKLASAGALAGPDLRRFRQVRAELDELRGNLAGGSVVAQASH
jgi:murein DD-endopeptidase MepM/ murein hydrolase activator NlpD